ncbi:DNA repair protein XRCC1 [Holothuria leucospilota]|uniref:DNA repair protein XRCC1 n=1 Tax=Holothuria leucospilota TaxID=206669 RepID=A0A9Q1BYH2_HOLLE|nr:DNA repair protein XRCC1 [Holothuria leucospilota]
MNPIESKNGSNANRVRMFGPDKLCKTVLGKRWDRLKIVCTQPFNKHIRYGLSFIKLHSPPEETDSTSPTSQKMLGKFTLKEESPAPLIKAGSFFKDRNQPKEEPAPLKGAAAIRAASYQTPSEKDSSSPRKKQTTLDFKPAPKASPSVPSSSQSTPSRRSPEPKQPKKRKLPDEDSRESSSAQKQTEQTKKKHLEKTKESGTKRFDEIMKGVTFVLSGYQNPYRGEIRDKGLKMGAKYEANWGPGCTHLICAFVNTPKYQQVHGKGKIVGKEWILDSYRKKCLQPWKRYKLRKGDESSSSEDDSEAEDAHPPARQKVSPTPERQEKRTLEPKLPEEKNVEKKKEDTPSPEENKKEEEEYVGSTDVESIGDGEKSKDALGSDADTEDELNQLKSDQQQEDPFAGSTDEEEDAEEVRNKSNAKDDDDWDNIPELPDFFDKKHFLFYGKFSADTRRQLHRFVIAFGGQEENYMSDKVDFVVTESNWDKSFDEALKENKSLVFVRPRWLHTCNQKGKMVSHESYAIERE